MTFLRSTLFNLFFFFGTFIMTVVLATPVRFFAPDRMLEVAQLWARIMLRAVRLICGIRVQVLGAEYLRGSGAKLIASRHQSAFDTLIWFTLLPRCAYVLKKELRSVPLFGPLLPLAGMIPVDRKGGAAALRGLVREGEQAARNGREIVIFPEGTRSEPDVVLPLHPGIAALAARTHLPVTPVVTDSGRFWSRRAFQKRAGTIHIRVLEPIPAGTPRDELMQRLKAAMHADVVPVRELVENSVG